LNLSDLGFARSAAAATGRPGYHPADMLALIAAVVSAALWFRDLWPA